MKKRRELDALVNGGKQPGSSSSRTVKNGRHELLRNDSDSSEVEEFSMPQKGGIRKRERCHFCSTCLTICSSFLLVLCMIAVGSLIWMNIQLKNEVYQLRNQLSSVEKSTKDIPEHLRILSEDQDKLKKTVLALTDSDGQPVLKQSVDSLSRQLQAVNSTLVVLSQSQASASASGLHDVQDHFTQLSRNVADIGSHVQELQEQQSGVTQQLKDLRTRLDVLQVTKSPLSTLSSGTPSLEEYVQAQFRHFSSELGIVNDTLNEKVDLLAAGVYGQTKLVMSVRNETRLLKVKLSTLDKQVAMSVNSTALAVEDAVHNAVQDEVEKFRGGNTQADSQNASVVVVEELQKVLEEKISILEAQDVALNSSITTIMHKIDAVAESVTQATTVFGESIKSLRQTTDMIDSRLDDIVKSVEDSLHVTSKPRDSQSTSSATVVTTAAVSDDDKPQKPSISSMSHATVP
jgi:chromosome segregation ATPase